jgi:hypothetical protein
MVLAPFAIIIFWQRLLEYSRNTGYNLSEVKNMVPEDEMSLPYLVFRIWRDYYDSLCLVEKFLSDEEYDRAQAQMEQAEAFLGKAKTHLLQRGMSPNDTCIQDITAACLEHRAQVSTDRVKAMLKQAALRKTRAAELL